MDILDTPEASGNIDKGSGDDVLLENADYLDIKNCPNWKKIRRNIKTALLDYPLYKTVKKPDGKCVLYTNITMLEIRSSF